MKAARFYGKRDIRVERVTEPGRLGPTDVLIRPVFCGICGTDLHEYLEGAIVISKEPHPLTGSTLPQIMGHELSADVVEVGREVSGVKVGDRVAIMPLIYCGRCYYCLRGWNHLCSIQACTGLSSPWGGFAELAIVEEYQIAVLPETVSYEQAALLEPAAVAAYAVERSGMQGGDVVLVAGAGPIGALAALYAKALGAGHVYVSETNPQRLRLAHELAVTGVFNPAEMTFKTEDSRSVGSGVFDAVKSPVAQALRDVTGGIGVDVAIDATGSEAGLATCINATRSRGTVVEAALQIKEPRVDLYGLALKDCNLVGTWCYNVFDFPRYLRVIGTGDFPVDRVITHKVPLEDVVAEGFEVLVDPKGSATKVLVDLRATCHP